MSHWSSAAPMGKHVLKGGTAPGPQTLTSSPAHLGQRTGERTASERTASGEERDPPEQEGWGDTLS